MQCGWWSSWRPGVTSRCCAVAVPGGGPSGSSASSRFGRCSDLRTVELRDSGGPRDVSRGGSLAGVGRHLRLRLGAAALVVGAVGRFEHGPEGDWEIRQSVGRCGNLVSWHQHQTDEQLFRVRWARGVKGRELKWGLRMRWGHTLTEVSRASGRLLCGTWERATGLSRRERGCCDHRWLPAGVV